MTIQRMSFAEFQHMFNAGYIREFDRELIQELIDYIGEDPTSSFSMEINDLEDEKQKLQKENDTLQHELKEELNKNWHLREQLRQLTSNITNLHEKSKEFVDRRIEMRSY